MSQLDVKAPEGLSVEEELAYLKSQVAALKIARDDHFRNAQRLASENTKLRDQLATVEKTVEAKYHSALAFIGRRVEMATFDPKHCSPKEAVDTILHHPILPFHSQTWDVDHKAYAEAFYKKFPNARPIKTA